MTDAIFPVGLNVRRYPDASRSVHEPSSVLSFRVRLSPCGAAYDPSAFFPNRTTSPVGCVASTLPDPSGSASTLWSHGVDQPGPNAPVVRMSCELYVRVSTRAGPATVTAA